MTQLTIQQAFQTALQHHQAGRLPQAEAIYRQILAQEPNHADALHLLGVIAHQVARHDLAVELIGRAIALHPHWPEALNNLGIARRAHGQLEQAIAAFRQALILKPDSPETCLSLGSTLSALGHMDEAVAACRQAIALAPHFAEAYSDLGITLKNQGQLDAAIAAYRQAITLKPGFPEAYNNLGNALRDQGLLEQSVTACRQAIASKPTFGEAFNNLGNALKEMGKLEEAMDAWRQAIALTPNLPHAHSNLGVALQNKGLLDEAIAEYRQAIALAPGHADGYNNLGNAMKDQGYTDDAIAAFRQAVALDPGDPVAGSNLLLTLNYHPATTPESLLQEARRWAQQHAGPLRQFIKPQANNRDPARRLRIAYVSPDLRDHVVARFLLPLLAGHDQRQFEIFIYASLHVPDAITGRLQGHVDTWRNIVGLSNLAAAELVRADRIDILIDLSGHTAGHRLLLFAQKPAPVQATWLGYPGTTGLETIDYRITDEFLDPPGAPDASCYTEQLLRLQRPAGCYQSILEDPGLAPPPALASGRVTFGCLNNFCKVSDPTLAVWAQLLQEVPHADLLLYAHEGAHRQRVQQQLAQAGIDPARVRFVGHGGAKYLAFYQQIDIVLDPFPYTGSTTTCDALWMGVPVVTLTGRSIVSRMSRALLSIVGRTEWIATTEQQYLAHARDLAGDLPRLAELRRTLRGELQRSPLMDAAGFVQGMEAAYRQMWRTWCAQAPGAHST